MAKEKKTAKHGHQTGPRDLVSIRSAKNLKDLLPTKRRNRMSKVYGYKA